MHVSFLVITLCVYVHNILYIAAVVTSRVYAVVYALSFFLFIYGSFVRPTIRYLDSWL